METPDVPELEPFVAGMVRGKKWIPPPPDEKTREADEKIAIDMGEEYEQALTDASQEEIIDLAGKQTQSQCHIVIWPSKRKILNLNDGEICCNQIACVHFKRIQFFFSSQIFKITLICVTLLLCLHKNSIYLLDV